MNKGWYSLSNYVQGRRLSNSRAKLWENAFQYRIKLILTSSKRYSSPTEKRFSTIWHSPVVYGKEDVFSYPRGTKRYQFQHLHKKIEWASALFMTCTCSLTCSISLLGSPNDVLAQVLPHFYCFACSYSLSTEKFTI